MKKKLLISFLLICVIIIALVAIIKNQEDNPNKVEFVNYPTFTVMASSEKNNLIDLNTSFNLNASEETTLELVQSSFSITPKVEYEITEIRKDYYELTLKEELKADTIYNIEYKTNEAPYKWSFQTEKKFSVANFYPANSEYVMPSTVIEMDFTYIPDENIEEYFSISPNVDGTFSFDERRVRFIPNEKLKLATTYEVMISEGYGNQENDEKTKEHSFKFSTIVSEKLGNLQDLNRLEFIDKKYAFGEGQDIYITCYAYSAESTTQDYRTTIYQYRNAEDYINDIKTREEYGSYPELKPIDLSRLDKISEQNLSGTDVIEYGWRKALPIKANLAEGYYMLVITENNINYYIPLQVNNMMAVTEYFDDTLIAWVHDLKTGAPLQNVNIKIDDTIIGITNKDGYCFAKGIKLPEDKNLEMQIYAQGKTTIYDIINSHSYDWYTSEEEFNNTYIRFDRYTLKAGETINAWGFIKDRKNRQYKECMLTVKSLSDDAIFEEKTVSLDEFGTFESSFDLTNYTSGYYYISVYVNGKPTGGNSFEIKDYETNSYDISLELDKEYVKIGEEITCLVNAKLFDGTPLANSKFNATIIINNNKTTREITTDENGIAYVKIDTNIDYNYHNSIYGEIDIVPIGIEDQNATYASFTIYPHEESFNVNAIYKYDTNSYNFTIETYKNDFSNMENVKQGEPTTRSGKIAISKYRKNKVVTSTYYDENTKTMKENYRIERIFEGTEDLYFTTNVGKATLNYTNPYANIDEGEIEFTSYIYSDMDSKNIHYRWPYVSGYYDYGNETTNILMKNYHIKYDQNANEYKFGENILLEVTTKDNEELNIKPYVLYIVKSAKGTEVFTTKDNKYNLNFKKEYGADICIEGFVFDGACIRKLGSYYYETERRYSVSNDELKIDVNVELDKNQYRPGETAKIKVTTKVDGEPVEAAVNLSAVNKEYLAANEQYTNIISALHNYYNFYIKAETYTHTILSDSMEGGGGGGDGSVRTNFATTAFFETIYTDENGVATYEVTLPDNITTWSVSVQATTKEYRAAQIDKDIVVTLPFFTTAVMNEKYLVDETPSISIRSNGTAVNIGDEVIYDVKITDENNNVLNRTKESKVGQYAQVSLGKLEEGTYKIFVKATSGQHTDAFEKEIDVVKTFQETTNTIRYNLEKNQKVSVEKGSGTIYLYNSDIEKIFDDLYELATMPSIRNDQKVVSYIAESILRKLQNINKPIEVPYIDTYNGIALIDDVSNPDALLTAKIASTGFIENSDEYCIKYFESTLKDNDRDFREKLYCYWGLAALKEPVLNELINIEKELSEEDTYEKAILALAYADIGDYTRASKIYDELVNVILDEEVEVYEYITMLAFKLNKQERENLYAQYLTLNRETEFSNFVKLFRIQNEIQNNVSDAYVVFEVNGEEKKYNINGVSIETISFTYKDNILIKDKTENVMARFRKTENVNEDNISKLKSISKTYTVNGKTTDEFKVGDTVTVTIKLDYGKLVKEDMPSLYLVEDVLPNCMKFAEQEDYDYRHLKVDSPTKKDGQRLHFYIHKCDDGEQYISYTAIVTSKGEYVSDGVILKNVDNEIIDYYKGKNIQVK